MHHACRCIQVWLIYICMCVRSGRCRAQEAARKLKEHFARQQSGVPARVKAPLEAFASTWIARHHLLQTARSLAPLAYSRAQGTPCRRCLECPGVAGCILGAQAAAILPRHPVRSERAQGTTATMRQSLVYHEQRGHMCEAIDSPLTSSTRHGCHWCFWEPSFSPRPCAAEARRQGAQEILPLPPLGPRRRLRRTSARTVDLAKISSCRSRLGLRTSRICPARCIVAAPYLPTPVRVCVCARV
jgi:hypothetical protein